MITATGLLNIALTGHFHQFDDPFLGMKVELLLAQVATAQPGQMDI